MSETADPSGGPQETSGEYVVVARRYRPQSFLELVGQAQVSKALANAIETQRVGHAYLFTGARGVGKTSTARIFSKALNCTEGPTPSPCNKCDICLSITSGDDVDVLEIDGASNRGIDEIRQLRSNVNIRPSRARFKIYIIDEVHMLTTQAFNALLKTLEEPPEHVKFMFCTTDPEKIPITVLSRCQRFDFSPVSADAIQDRLQHIVSSEQVTADADALQLLARRAAGSMRDSQSLLEQLLSFGGQHITVKDVHLLLGTADSGRLADLTKHLIKRDAAVAIGELDRAIEEGVEVGQLAEQLVGYFRDLMAAAVGCSVDQMLHIGPDDFADLQSTAQEMGVETTLAVLQILDNALTRMRQSTQPRMLLEVALVRICNLEVLEDLQKVISEIQGSGLPSGDTATAAAPAVRTRSNPPVQQKKNEINPPSEGIGDIRPYSLESGSPEELWKQALSYFEDMTSDFGLAYERVANPAPNQLVVSFPAGYTLQKEGCDRPERKARLEQILSKIAGKPIRVDFQFVGEVQKKAVARPRSMRQKIRDMEKNDFVRKAAELFDAEVTRLEEP